MPDKFRYSHLEKLDTSSITKNSENGRNQFLYSPLASPQCIKLHVTNFESEKTPQEYDHKRVRSRCVNRETKLKDRLVNNSLNTSFANTRYSGFKNSNSELLNTPVLSRRKLARVKKARKRVSSIGIDSGNALNLSQNCSINDQYLRNNQNFRTIYSYENGGINWTIGTHSPSPLILMPSNLLLPPNLSMVRVSK